MFAGTSAGGTFGFQSFNDLWKLDLTLLTWSLLYNDNQSDTSRPPALNDHFLFVFEDEILLFNGQRFFPATFTATSFQELWTYSIPSNTWTLLPNTSWSPDARRRVSPVLLNDDFLLVQNGDLPKQNYVCCRQIFPSVNPTNMATLFSWRRKKWIEVDFLSNPPETRRSNIVELNGFVYLFGGSDYNVNLGWGNMNNPYIYKLGPLYPPFAKNA